MDTILLIDHNNFAWKGAGWKADETTVPSYTIVYGFFRNLKSLIEQFYPRRIFLCGEGGRTFRHELFSGYKANRILKTAEEEEAQSTRQAFYEQSNIIWSLAEHLPLQRVFAKGFEADDVIFSLASSMPDEDVVIVSNDSDFVQMIQKDGLSEHVELFDPFKREYVEAPFYHYLTYKICAGDKADNIPKLMTPKKAASTASNPEVLAAFLDASEENRANYALNKALIELRDIGLDKLTFMPYHRDYETLAKEFTKMRFNSFLEDFTAFTETFKDLS